MLLAAQSRAKAVVIGGGLLGLEAAAGLQSQGMDVTVVHLMPTLMERQLDPAAGYLLQKALEERGIKVLTKANTKAILGNGQGRRRRARRRHRHPGDAGGHGGRASGRTPALAKDAGLTINRGIVVDACDADIRSGHLRARRMRRDRRARLWPGRAALRDGACRRGQPHRRRDCPLRARRYADQAQGHRHRPLFAGRLRRRRRPRGDRAARRLGRRLQAPDPEGRPDHRHGAVRRNGRRRLVQRPQEEVGEHLGDARHADLRARRSRAAARSIPRRPSRLCRTMPRSAAATASARAGSPARSRRRG